MTERRNTFVVLYRSRAMKPLDPPRGFVCFAPNGDAAEQQCLFRYPSADVVWVAQTNSIEAALHDYYGEEPEDA